MIRYLFCYFIMQVFKRLKAAQKAFGLTPREKASCDFVHYMSRQKFPLCGRAMKRLKRMGGVTRIPTLKDRFYRSIGALFSIRSER